MLHQLKKRIYIIIKQPLIVLTLFILWNLQGEEDELVEGLSNGPGEGGRPLAWLCLDSVCDS